MLLERDEARWFGQWIVGQPNRDKLRPNKFIRGEGAQQGGRRRMGLAKTTSCAKKGIAHEHDVLKCGGRKGCSQRRWVCQGEALLIRGSHQRDSSAGTV